MARHILKCTHLWNIYSNDRSKQNNDRRTCILCEREEQLEKEKWTLVSHGKNSIIMNVLLNIIGYLIFFSIILSIIIVGHFLYPLLFFIITT